MVSEILFVGTYTDTSSRGIYALRFDSDSGVLSAPFLAAKTADPSFLAFDRKRSRIYAVEESATGGRVRSFAVDSASLSLNCLDQQPTGGTLACHVELAAGGAGLLVTNYGSGSVCSIPLAPDGRLGPQSSLHLHRGPLGPRQPRQEQAHPHCATLTPDGAYALVCDLGLDRIFVYRIDSTLGALFPSDPPSFAALPGSGPRHGVFSADGRFFHVINELAGSISTFAWEGRAGSLSPWNTVSTLPKDFSGRNDSAAVAIAPPGRFVYASNRGPDNLAVFECNPEDGTLNLIQHQATGGNWPRHFTIAPNGRWLLCANQRSDRIVVFAIDPATGRLSPTGRESMIARPACLLFYSVPQ